MKSPQEPKWTKWRSGEDGEAGEEETISRSRPWRLAPAAAAAAVCCSSDGRRVAHCGCTCGGCVTPSLVATACGVWVRRA